MTDLERLQKTRDVKWVSDGYHTFDELYQHRCLLYINLCLAHVDKCAWKPHYPGWPVLFYESPGGQISYHVEEKWLPLFEHKIRRDDNYAWDGHTSVHVLERLLPRSE